MAGDELVQRHGALGHELRLGNGLSEDPVLIVLELGRSVLDPDDTGHEDALGVLFGHRKKMPYFPLRVPIEEDLRRAAVSVVFRSSEVLEGAGKRKREPGHQVDDARRAAPVWRPAPGEYVELPPSEQAEEQH